MAYMRNQTLTLIDGEWTPINDCVRPLIWPDIETASRELRKRSWAEDAELLICGGFVTKPNAHGLRERLTFWAFDPRAAQTDRVSA